MIDSSSPTHPTDEAVAAYLEAVLPASERTLLERHVEDCEYCRARLVLAGRSLQTSPRPLSQTRWIQRGLVGLAAAAAVAGILLLPRWASTPAVVPSEIRTTEQDVTAPALQTIAPRVGDTVGAANLRLLWLSQGPDALYQITVSGADGSVLWSERTADTAAAPPGEILRRLQPGQRYFWRVDALLPTLRSLSSGDQPFQVSR